MNHIDMVEQIRTLVRATMSDLGGEEPQHLQETILIRDGFYCGRRFQSESMQAIWFIEEDEVKFSTVDAGVVRVYRPAEAAGNAPRRAA